MTPDDNKALVRRYYETAYNERNLAAIHDFLALDFTSAGPGAATMDLATHTQTLAMSQAALPDLRLTIEQQVAEGISLFRRFGVAGEYVLDDDDMAIIIDPIPHTGCSPDFILYQASLPQLTAQRVAATRVWRAIVRRLREMVVATTRIPWLHCT